MTDFYNHNLKNTGMDNTSYDFIMPPLVLPGTLAFDVNAVSGCVFIKISEEFSE